MKFMRPALGAVVLGMLLQGCAVIDGEFVASDDVKSKLSEKKEKGLTCREVPSSWGRTYNCSRITGGAGAALPAVVGIGVLAAVLSGGDGT